MMVLESYPLKFRTSKKNISKQWKLNFISASKRRLVIVFSLAVCIAMLIMVLWFLHTALKLHLAQPLTSGKVSSTSNFRPDPHESLSALTSFVLGNSTSQSSMDQLHGSRLQPLVQSILKVLQNISPSSTLNGTSKPNATQSIFNVQPRLDGRWDTRHMYKLIDSALVGSRFNELSANYSVCLATQSSLEKLHSLVQVADHWAGPISVALFAEGDREFSILQNYMDFLMRCYAPAMETISFQLAFPRFAVPTSSSFLRKSSNLDCSNPKASLQELLKLRSPDLAGWRLRHPYPQNHLRNLARKNCQSKHVFITDVDIIPSWNLANALDNFFKSEQCSKLCAYVVPTYELDNRAPFPQNKSELVRLAVEGLARPFHQKVFIKSQYDTNFSRWEQDNTIAMQISYKVTNYRVWYEPFYVAGDLVPLHDERFIGYGYTRNSQVYEMHVAGYEFFVLSPVFTIHWGFQYTRDLPQWRVRQRQDNLKHWHGFEKEVLAKYRKAKFGFVMHEGPNSKFNLSHIQSKKAVSRDPLGINISTMLPDFFNENAARNRASP